MPDLSRLTTLIIDANPTMRTQLRNMLADSRLERVDLAVSAGTAVLKLREQQFDMTLCESHLCAGQDGQQLLEDPRNNTIPLKTLFLMMTGTSYFSDYTISQKTAPLPGNPTTARPVALCVTTNRDEFQP